VHGSVGLSEEQFRGLEVLLCDEAESWPRRGIGGPSERYQVELTAFGKLLVARLTWENPVGTAVAARSAQISELDQLPAGLLRLLRALRPRDEAASAPLEMPSPPPPPGEIQSLTFVDLILGGYTFLGMEGSKSILLATEVGRTFSPRWAWVASARAVLGEEKSLETPEASMLGLSLGVRHLGAYEGAVPFVGGGWSILGLIVHPPGPAGTTAGENNKPYKGSGLGAYLEGGMGLLNKKGGLLLGGRLDLPFFRLKQPTGYLWNAPPGTPTEIPGSSRRIIPISLSISGQFR
jgi:hypothetical protein